MPSVLISGANRGLGLEFTRQYLDDNWRVIALCRDTDAAMDLSDLGATYATLEIFQCDVGDFEAIDEIAQGLRGRTIDVLLNNTGVFGPKRKADGDFRQSFGHIDFDILSDVLRVNTLAPLKIVEALVDNVLAGEQKKIVIITSKLGSIANTSPGLYAYRTSKAAVNMVMATLARELGPRGGIVAALNPGWVQTDMGGADANLTAAESIGRMRQVIAGLTIEQSGAFLDYDGSTIAW